MYSVAVNRPRPRDEGTGAAGHPGGYGGSLPRASRSVMGFDPTAELGPRLRQVREQRGLSARELARRIQCSPSLISQIERGLSAPSVGMLYALATELRTSLDFLFSAAAPAAGLTLTAHG